MCNALTVTKRESAPLPERLCERIAYCTAMFAMWVNFSDKFVQCEGADHRRHSTPEMQNILLQNVVGHVVRKAKNFAGGATDTILSGRQVLINLMSDFVLDKTKATAEGRQWVLRQIKLERITNNATFAAGGQSVTGKKFRWGYSCSLALRRCSYFNLRPQASKTHAEKLALGLVNFSCSTLASIPSISSCGNRMFFFADLLFVFPLDIGTPHLNGFDGRTQYSKKSEKLSIDMCAHMILICAHSLGCIAQIKQRPAVLATHAGRLTTNDSKSIEVAMLNHTTHPQGRDSHNLNKYIWRFIALSDEQPRVIHIEATSEQEARQQSPAGCVMVFAARIRQEVNHG
ncbi:host cell division inhibitor Icd-like protein [Escherichia coli]|nr:host cell division inhibitor Icd-like protein [Escherichia coli]